MAARLDGDLDLFKVNVRDGSFERIAIGTSGPRAGSLTATASPPSGST
jgi:hypothetical protein